MSDLNGRFMCDMWHTLCPVTTTMYSLFKTTLVKVFRWHPWISKDLTRYSILQHRCMTGFFWSTQRAFLQLPSHCVSLKPYWNNKVVPTFLNQIKCFEVIMAFEWFCNISSYVHPLWNVNWKSLFVVLHSLLV